MALSDTERQKVEKHLAGKINPCPMCGNDKWELLEIIAPPVQRRAVGGVLEEYLTWGKTAAPAEAVPLLLVACTNCFHVVPYAWRLIERQGA